MSTMTWSPLDTRILRTLARVWASAAFLVWGAFFLEHTVEWFDGGAPSPPMAVRLLQVAHLMLLTGLALGWKYELAGGLLTLVSAVVFFGSVAGSRALPFIVLTAAPAPPPRWRGRFTRRSSSYT